VGVVWGQVRFFWRALSLGGLQLVLQISRVGGGVSWRSMFRSRHLGAPMATSRRTDESMYMRICAGERVDHTRYGALPDPRGATAGTPAADVGLAASHGLHSVGQAAQYDCRLLVADREGWEESHDVCVAATEFAEFTRPTPNEPTSPVRRSRVGHGPPFLPLSMGELSRASPRAQGTAYRQQAPPRRYQPRAAHGVTGCSKILAVAKPLPSRGKSPTASA
jgi:hypothetical protein